MSHQAVAKPKLRRTPHEEVGPMYPVVKPADRGFDLTVNPANGETAKGQVVYLSGRVLDTTGAAIAGAHVELWQTNMHGRYDHPADPNPAPLDENFEGFGTAVTGADGRYAFKTIKPAAYHGSGPGW
jgi:protocatechuate 3,4-dioxygenase beta subunit